MSYQYPYSNQNVNDRDSIFEDVYIYGKFNYDFSGDDMVFNDVTIKGDLTVEGYSLFLGITTFKNLVDIGSTLTVDYLNVNSRFNVGEFGEVLSGINTGPLAVRGRVGVANTAPFHRFQVGGPNTVGTPNVPGGSIEPDSNAFVVTGFGTVGIGSTDPSNFEGMSISTTGPLKLDVMGPIRIDGHIYDSAESPGLNGYYLNMDVDGIRWVQASPISLEGIFVQDQGVYLPNPGTAQTFSTLNFVQENSLGLGTDTLIPVPDPDNPTMIAKIQTQDLWGHNGTGNNAKIFRMTKVGINNNNPIYQLDVGGNFQATSDAQIGNNLNVDGDTTLNKTLDVDGATTLNSTLDVDGATTLNSTLDVDGATTLNLTLDVDGGTTLNSTLDVDGATTLNSTLDVDGATTLNNTLDVDGGTTLNNTLDVDGNTTFNSILDASSPLVASVQIDGGLGVVKKVYIGDLTRLQSTESSTNSSSGALVVEGGVGIKENLYVNKLVRLESTESSTNSSSGALVVEGGVGIKERLNVAKQTIIEDATTSTDKDSGALIVDGGVGIEENLNVGGNTKLIGTLELENSILDKLNNAGYDVNRLKNDYRLSAVGAGVSWRPSGVDTENAIWVTVDGDDNNTGFLEGDAKRTIGGAAAIAKEGDTIIIRSGSYVENNPIGLRTDVSVSGEDLRLVTIIPEHRTKDVFHVRRGCLIQNINFSGPPDDGKGGVSYAHTGAGAVAFPPLESDDFAKSGYIAAGPANEGATGRWKSPYVRNCTNFMTASVGMKIDGDHANADFTGTNNLGQDLKSMVCDAFTQYNEAGIGVSITNNAYAQLVSIFTIASDIGISCSKGGQCDLTNSNSSFGNFGLVADGVGATEFTGTVSSDIPAENDTFPIANCTDSLGRFRKPFDGQGLFFKINLSDYLDTSTTGILDKPMQLIRSIKVIDGGQPGEYNAAAPPVITVPRPLGPESIQAEFSANVSAAGTITSVDVISSGRNFLPNQSFVVNITGGGSAQLQADTDPILYTVSIATEPTRLGLTTVTFDQFIPYEVPSGIDIELVRLSRIITSSHSFEYIGAGTDINKANPFQGGVPITANEVIAINGGQCPFTSTDQKGNFRIGDGLTVDQTTSTIRGRDFNRAIQAQLTPLILALR